MILVSHFELGLNMKILFIVGQFPLLSETFILNQITGLIDRGHEVHIYATELSTGWQHDDFERYDLLRRTFFCREIPGGRFSRYFAAFRLACMLGISDPEMLLNAIKALKHGHRFSSLMIFYDLNSIGGRQSYDIINCHFGYHGNRGMLLREIGVLHGKLVTTFHGFDITAGLKKAGSNVYDSLFKRGDLFLPISDRWRKRLIDLGCDETKIQVHRMGIDCHRFVFKPRFPKPDGSIKIATVARMVEKKGLEYGIRAFAGLKKKYGNVEYIIVGDGPLKPNLELLIKKLDVQNSVRILGPQDQNKVVEILDSSHLFMLPSVTASDGDQEGIPVVLMEAMAAGLPVISTIHSGIPELVEDGLSGFLVPEKDETALFERLKYLVANSHRWPEMGHHGRKIVEARYDINRLNDKLVKIYEQLLAENK